MIDTVEKAIYPLCVVISFCGSGIFRYPVHKPRPYLSFFYILSLWSVYLYAFYYVVTYINPGFSNNILLCFIIVTNLLLAIISIIITIFKDKNFYTCVRKLDLVDDTLEKLGTPKAYHKIRNLVKRILIIWITMICVTIIIDSIWLLQLYKDPSVLFIPLVMNYSLYIGSLMDIKFMLLLRCIGNRFDKINEHVARMCEIRDCGLKCTWKKSFVLTRYYVGSTETCKRILYVAMHLHLELCQISRDINSLFGIQITLQMISYFIIVIILYVEFDMARYLIQMHANKVAVLKLVLSILTWFIIYMTRLILLNHACESVSSKAQNVRNIIYNFNSFTRFTKMHEEIFQFVLQMSLRPLQFTGMDLFCFGYRFIRKFFFWVITAIVFLMQIYISHLHENLIEDNHYKNIMCNY